MNSLNSILLEGNLTKDPQGKTTAKGQHVCNFSIASNRWFSSGEEYKEEVSYFDIEIWGSGGERCLRDLKKGRGVRVVGRLKQDRWEDAEGKTHSRIKVLAEHVEFKPQFNKGGTKELDEPAHGEEAGLAEESREAVLV